MKFANGETNLNVPSRAQIMGGTRFAGVFPALRTFSSLLQAKAASGVVGEVAADDVVQVLRRGAPCAYPLAEEGASAVAGAEAYE